LEHKPPVNSPNTVITSRKPRGRRSRVCNMRDELMKAADGKKTKLSVELLIYFSMKHHPAIQRKLREAFSIS